MAGNISKDINSVINEQKVKVYIISGLPIVHKIVPRLPGDYNREEFEAVAGYFDYRDTMATFLDNNVALAYTVSAGNGILGLNTWIDLPLGYDGREQESGTRQINNALLLLDDRVEASEGSTPLLPDHS